MAKLSKRLRFEVLRRDGHRCRYCGAGPEEKPLQVDHVIPEALGGTNDPSNLATACEPCNGGKSSTTPDAPTVDQVADDALRWSAAMQAAAQLKEQEIEFQDKLRHWFMEEWLSYTPRVPLPGDWEYAIDRLDAAGLNVALFLEAIKATMRARGVLAENRFRYFCGVAWNMIKDLQQSAQEILVDGEPRERSRPPKTKGAVADALDAAMDATGSTLEPWLYDELVIQLAQRLGVR